MHKSHQTRLTGLNNQLNEQHGTQIGVLKEDYEAQLYGLQETLKKLQEPNLEAEKLVEEQKQELLSKIQELESISLESKTGFEQELSELKSQSSTQIEELVTTHQKQLDDITDSLKVSKNNILLHCILILYIGRNRFPQGYS